MPRVEQPHTQLPIFGCLSGTTARSVELRIINLPLIRFSFFRYTFEVETSSCSRTYSKNRGAALRTQYSLDFCLVPRIFIAVVRRADNIADCLNNVRLT